MVVEYIKLIGFGDAVIQIYNEGAGRAKRGKTARKTGLRPGASDLFIAVAKHNKHGFWLELKSKEGKLSPAQMSFFTDMEKRGYFTAAAWSFDEAKEVLDWYFLDD